MTETDIVRLINEILSSTETVVKHLKAEKKETGNYSKEFAVHKDGVDIVFYADKYRDNYPPISINLTFLVKVFQDGKEIMRSRVAPIKNAFSDHYDYDNQTDKYKSWVLICETSHITPLFKSGETICLKHGKYGKVAYAKLEILSEEYKDKYITRNVRLYKELGHKEVLAYEKGYPAQVGTYITDESTEEYFGENESIDLQIKTFYKSEKRTNDFVTWHVYTYEDTTYGCEIEIATPLTEDVLLYRLKQEALERLLEDCRGEFCHNDKRVEKYREFYMILGEETINNIYKVYMSWLTENCTTTSQESYSGEFWGVSIDWNGKENLQPVFNL